MAEVQGVVMQVFPPLADRKGAAAAKRGFDIVVSSVALVIASPLIALLLVGSAVVFRANPVFIQGRVGRNGRVIPVPKVRTIPPDGPRAADKRELTLTPIPWWGRALRRNHLDELPQLWSVLVGHMSLIGPRPEMPWLAERFDPTFAAMRSTVRPGITGLWQISAGSAGLIHETPEFDTIYLTQWRPRLDVWIIWKTVRMYLPGGSTVTIDDLPDWVQTTHPVENDEFSIAATGG